MPATATKTTAYQPGRGARPGMPLGPYADHRIKYRECPNEQRVQRNLRALRRKLNYTLEYVGGRVGLAHQTIQAYEVGRAVPKIETLVKLAGVFGVTLDALVLTHYEA